MRSKGGNATVNNRINTLAKNPYIKVLCGDLTDFVSKPAILAYESYLSGNLRILYKVIRLFYEELYTLKNFNFKEIGKAYWLNFKKFLKLNLSRLCKLRNHHLDLVSDSVQHIIP